MEKDKKPPKEQLPPVLKIDLDKLFGAIEKQAQAEKKVEISAEAERFYLREIFTIIFGERWEGWFFGFKRVFTLLFVPLLFVLVVAWLAFCGYFLWYAAFHRENFGLSDNVLIAMITSTTATVIGLFHYAARWMFTVNPKDQDDPSNSN